MRVSAQSGWGGRRGDCDSRRAFNSLARGPKEGRAL